MKFRGYFCAAVVLFLAVSTQVIAQPAVCPSPVPNPPPVTISWQFPQDVCLPSTDTPGIPFFDDFSWHSFVALIWPSVAGQRGKANTAAVPAGGGVPVFQTYKADWEVFQPTGSTPTPWASYGATKNPCGNVPPGAFVLAADSKFGNLHLAGVGSLAGPLISQNVQYTRFLAAFNQVSFDDIVNGKWYLQSGLTKPITFTPDALQNNPIDIKSSWVIMTPGMNANRFYTTSAYVYDTAANTCKSMTVGLVGLHIVTKTPSRPQWIWSTFEQVDALPQPGAKKPYTYNDGSGTAMPAKNPISEPTPVPCVPAPTGTPCPFNLDRLQKIDPSTIATNTKYQNALAARGSGVWQYYQLVMTQWPTPAHSTKNGGPANTIPGNIPTPFAGPMTSFSNITMEPFEQVKIGSGCMACHNSAAGSETTDFNWALPMNAYPSDLGTARPPMTHVALKATAQPKGIKNLIAIMTQAQKDMEASPKTSKPGTPKSVKPKAKAKTEK